MGMLKQRHQHGIRLPWGMVGTVIMMGALLACDQDALVRIDVTGDVVYSDVELRLSATPGISWNKPL